MVSYKIDSLFDGRLTVTVHSIQGSLISRLPFQKQELNHRPLLLFFHFSKTRGYVRFKNKQKRLFLNTYFYFIGSDVKNAAACISPLVPIGIRVKL